MFTGLVACTGTVVSVSFRNNEARIEVRPGIRWERPEQGESIACNGVAYHPSQRMAAVPVAACWKRLWRIAISDSYSRA